MTIEDFFLKDYEKLKKKNIELEKNYKLLQIERDREKFQFKEVVDFLKRGQPYDTGDNYGYFSMTYWLNGDQREKAMRLLKKIGVEIKKDKEQL